MVKNELGQKHVTAGDEKSKCWYLLRLGFPDSSVGKESACNAGDPGSMQGRSPGEGRCYPLHYSGLENSMNYIVHRVAKKNQAVV